MSPTRAEEYLQQGMALRAQGRSDEALVALRQAIALNPSLAEAHYQLGFTLSLQGKSDEAITACQTALALKPDHADACCNIGYACINQGRIDEAEACFRQALAIKPGYVKALYNLGTACIHQGRAEEAAACLREAIVRQPDFAAAHSGLLSVMHNIAACTPDDLFTAHRHYAEQFETPLTSAWTNHANSRDPDRRLKVGYVSPDFRMHSVALFIEPILQHHNKSEVEIYGYYSHAQRDQMTECIVAHMDCWIPCAGMSDEQLSARIRADGIDILVDLAGHTQGNRLLTFARKPAPVQVTYLGYPDTTGLSAMDYRLTTHEVDPVGNESWHSERLYRLPRTLWCFRPLVNEAEISGPTPVSRQGFVTFGSMNNLIKVTPEMITLWAKILRAVPESRLAMTNVCEGSARTSLVARFAALGISPHRLSLHGRLPTTEFQALAGQIDVALDTFPYNGTTTTCEALWRGIPVVTLAGKTAAARSGYALLRMPGLTELVAQDEAGYFHAAIELSIDINRLASLRATVRGRFMSSPVGDPEGLVRDIEAAYRWMWGGWCAGGQ